MVEQDGNNKERAHKEMSKTGLESTTIKKMQFDSGYLSPDGKLYECPYAQHVVLAEIICLVKGYEYRRGENEDPKRTLEMKGWISISRNNFQFGFNPTGDQITFICEWAEYHDGEFIHNGMFTKLDKFMTVLEDIKEFGEKCNEAF